MSRKFSKACSSERIYYYGTKRMEVNDPLVSQIAIRSTTYIYAIPAVLIYPIRRMKYLLYGCPRVIIRI